MNPKTPSTALQKLGSLWLMFAIVAVSLAVREFYPLSRFPMYSNFPKEVRYYYFTDENGEEVTEMMLHFRQTAIRLQKMYDKKVESLKKERREADLPELEQVEQMKEAALPIIGDYLKYQRQKWGDEPKRTFTHLKVWVVFLDRKDGKLRREKHLLGEWTAPGAEAPAPANQKEPEETAAP